MANEAKLLKKLEEEQKARKEAEAKLKEQEVEKAKEVDPMSGPGELCECTKVTLSEAWQLKSQEKISPETGTEEMVTDLAPDGFVDRAGPNNTHFVVKPENAKPNVRLQDAAIPACQSKYTKTYTIKGKKSVQDSGNPNKPHPKVKLNLCERHASLFEAVPVK